MELRFKECPYSCNQSAKLYDRVVGKFVECPYCSKKRKELVKTGVGLEDVDTGDIQSIQGVLGFTDPYLVARYDMGLLFTEDERSLLEIDSLALVDSGIRELLGFLGTGELPSNSYCFGLSYKGRVDALAYALLVKAYEAGLKVGMFVIALYLTLLPNKPHKPTQLCSPGNTETFPF